MRLWHEELISKLPTKQLLGQHRECCALRGLGWGKKHSVVDYVFTYSPLRLFLYHLKVMREMETRGYNVGSEWYRKEYRGKRSGPWLHQELSAICCPRGQTLVYQEHNNQYLEECIQNLKNKGIEVKL